MENNKMKYVTKKQLCEIYPFTDGQISSYLLKRNENGLDKCVKKIGKRIYFRTDLFEEWIDSHGAYNEGN
jgi:hypothetical protein